MLRTKPVSALRLPSSGNGTGHVFPPALPLPKAVARARQCLLARQRTDGHWVGELQGDTILESEYILLMAFLGREHEPRIAKAARYLLRQQLPEGGWNNYPGGPAELSVSVKAYFALKLAGHDPEASSLCRARQTIRALGGAARCNTFTKFYLALLGQLPYAQCPAVPPEMMFLPRWAYLNLYAMSSWTRTILVPLSIVYACKPVRRLPPTRGIAELFREPPETPRWPHPPTRRWLTWSNLFLLLDRCFKRLEAWGLGPIRKAAVRRAAAWMREHFADSDGLGAIYPQMIYTIIGLRCLGVADDSPEMRWALRQLDNLVIEEGDTLRVQPTWSPVWDTALTLKALAEAGLASHHPALVWGVRWLLDREVRRRGDWNRSSPGLEPSGWPFEYRNAFYPDTDDTAMVLMALAQTGWAYSPTAWPTVARALHWLLGMQNRDGGWAAFDRGIDHELLTKVPFADHNAMLDPSCPDITGRVLEALGHFGYRVGNPPVDWAIPFLRRTQGRAGGWPGRWGVNYLYGTWQVLAGLACVGYDLRRPMVRRAVDWLERVQQPGGGWGETCGSCDDPSLAGRGTPTASQTAWALLGLLAAGEAQSAAVQRGIDYLLATQQPDGGWAEEEFTGTGFPRVFYLKYHMYPLYFPLMALARAARLRGAPLDPGPDRPLRVSRRRRGGSGAKPPRVGAGPVFAGRLYLDVTWRELCVFP
jgi:squalene-hopene/tetraprenyl-beta-curcumene cyclase